MEHQITVKDIIAYYSKKEDDLKDCPKTREYWKNRTRRDACRYLADDFELLNGKIKNDSEFLNKMLEDDSNKLEIAKECHGLDHYEFYKELKRIGLEDQYIFEDDPHHICAKIKVFEPYIEVEDKKIISEKWHLLISFYAFLDLAYKTQKEVYQARHKSHPMNYDHVITATPCDYWRLSEKYCVRSASLRIWMAEAVGIHDVLDSHGKINKYTVTWENVKNKLLEETGY